MRVTERQREYLRAIVVMADRLGHAPSLSEVSAEAESSVTSVRGALVRLRERGLVAYGGHRTLRLTEAGKAALAAGEAAE